ncbi:hypothetical protein B0H14DRAFT_3520387 [Mycena olivaceomarginata]|nr:hypothetical protein B0H14DRAFT_3520387 [Mycena olivaceomarginata]
MPSSFKASRTQNRVSATSLSSTVHITGSKRSQSGCVLKQRKTLTATKIRLEREEEARREAERLQAMTETQLQSLDRLRGDIPDAFDDNDDYEQDILHGRALQTLVMQARYYPQTTQMPPLWRRANLRLYRRLWGRYPDTRTRKNRTQQQVDAFNAQLDRMTDAYLDFSLAIADEGLAALSPDSGRQQRAGNAKGYGGGYFLAGCPVPPYFPNVVITIRALEVYRVTRLRCPPLGIQAFVRALCDIHGFDIYLAVRARVDGRVQAALGRDTPDWCLKNACPACLYKLEGEPHLKFPFMCTFDGNNSLSRFWSREREKSLADGTSTPGASKGAEAITASRQGMTEEESGCPECWQNMKEDVTARAYGMYDETGFFPALCRHGFVLKVVDMVKSGEVVLSKYPLAITAHLLNALGEVAIGYDIGCNRRLPRSRHGRLCGLDNLMTYVEGVGLEALEICDRFHRQQAITTYLKHTDTFETYQGLSNTSARWKSGRQESTLRASMRELGVESRDVFETVASEGRKLHLRTLSKEPKEETLEMEYLQKLINLRDAQDRVTGYPRGSRRRFSPSSTDAGYAEAASATRRIETQRRHALEVEVRARAAVHDLELRLAITTRWAPGDEKWIEVSAMLSKRRYQRALDHLQGLIIARMFELAKCNMSGTGNLLFLLSG